MVLYRTDMRMRTALLSALLPLFAVLQGCYYDKEEELYPMGNCDLSDVTWSGTVKAIVDLRCATPACHSASGTAPGDFTQYSAVKARVDDGSLPVVVFVNKTMPPSGMPGCELRKLQAWVNAGAANN
jgi:hypothetical protein